MMDIFVLEAGALLAALRGGERIFSFRRSLPPTLRSIPKERDS
jgi:hypothetical protein